MKQFLGAAATIAAVFTLTACSDSGGGLQLDRPSAPPTSAAAPVTSRAPVTSDVAVTTPAAPASAPNSAKVKEFVDEFKALQSTLESFWTDQINGYEKPGRTLAFNGTSEDPSTFPTCGGQRVSANNGFYCPPDNTVILDAEWMYHEYQTIGDTFLYVLLAHEYGHSAQANLSEANKPAAGDQEVQADCFSGAFLQSELDAGNITEEEGDEQEINETLASAAGDYGTTDDHGTLASRALAFEYGRTNGPASCLNVDQYRK